MELYPPCVSCVIRNVSLVAERVLPEDGTHFAFLRELLADMAVSVDSANAAPILTQRAYAILRKYSGVADPYAEEKRQFNELMLSLESAYRTLLEESSDPLETALVLTGAGNLIDFGAFDTVCPEELLRTLESTLEKTRLSGEAMNRFCGELEKHHRLLLLADNCGEIVLDKLLAEVLQKKFPRCKLTVVLRGGPALNDATLEDAHAVGLHEAAEVISSGSTAPGTPLSHCSEDFLPRFSEAPLILSKGVGNFECAPLEDPRFFFLFVVKCQVLSQRLGQPFGTLQFFRGKSSLSREKSK